MSSPGEHDETETRTVAEASGSAAVDAPPRGFASESLTDSVQLIEDKVRRRLFTLAAPTRVGRFIVLEEIGRGPWARSTRPTTSTSIARSR